MPVGNTPRSGVQACAESSDVLVHIVDDDEHLRQSLMFLLDSVGISSRPHVGAYEFLDDVDIDEPAVLIVDVRMPRLSGLQLHDHLRTLDYPAPIVFCSAHGDIPMSVRALQKGAVDFVEKPHDPQHMLEVVQVNLSEAARRFAARAVEHETRARLAALTNREREVLRLVIDGLPSQLIARRLGTSVKTIDVHRGRIKSKTGAISLAALVRDVLTTGVPV